MKTLLSATWRFYFAAGLIMLIHSQTLGTAVAEDDIAKHPVCAVCGADRAKFAHARVYITYEDGSTLGACSLHCAAIDLATHSNKTPKEIMVGDFQTKELIDAKNAFWVVGGSKPGVMSKRAKWAFKSGMDGAKFIGQYGGVPADFDRALKAAYDDMPQNTQGLRQKRKVK